MLQVHGESLVCVGDSDESHTDGNRLRETPGLVNHAGTYSVVKSTARFPQPPVGAADVSPLLSDFPAAVHL